MVNLNNAQGLQYVMKLRNIIKHNRNEGFDNIDKSDNTNNTDNTDNTDNNKFNNIINNINKSEIEELNNLKTEYDRALSDYNNELLSLNKMINNYTIASKSQYKNTNIQLSNGNIGYITNNGIWKEYSSNDMYNNLSGKGTCPSTQINDLKKLNGNIDTIYNTINIDDENKFLIGTPMKEGQGCGISGTNVYVTNTATPVSVQEYSGCYNLSESNGLIYQEDMGSNATIDSCRVRAFDTNNEVFALSNSNGLPNNNKCYIGKNLNNVINSGPAIYTRVIWRSNIEPLIGARSVRLNYAGQLEILDYQNNVLWTSNPPQDNCDPNNGGRIKIKTSSWGANCNGRKSNSRNEQWSVPTDNLLSYSTSLANGKDIAEFTLNPDLIIPETNNPIGDPAPGCKKYFRSSYRCGTQGGNLLKKIYEKGDSNGSLVTYDCQEHTKRCENFKLIVDDNLNVVINDGQINNNIWQTDTLNIVSNAVSNEIYNSLSGKYQREYIQPGELLEDNDFIGSINGKCYLIFVNDVGLELRISISGCTKSNNGNYYGGNVTDDINGIFFTIYNGYFNDDLSFFKKAMFINNGITKDLNNISSSTNNKYTKSNQKYSIVFTGVLIVKKQNAGEWTFNLTSDDASYMWIGNDALKNSLTSNAFISNGNVHSSTMKSNAITLDEGYYPIKIIFGNYRGNGVFNLTFSGPGVSERTNLEGYIYAYTPNDGLATYSIKINGDNTNNIGKAGYITPDGKLKSIPSRLIKLSNNEYGKNYIEIGNYSHFNDAENSIGIINSTNEDTCKMECNNKDDCYGFVYKDNKCYLKNNDIYPQSYRIYDENARLFKRNIDILTHSSCNKNIIPIDNNRWNDFPPDPLNSEIDEKFECEMTQYLSEQKSKLFNSENNLKDISSKIIDRINKLNKNDKMYIEQIGMGIENILKTVDNLNTNQKKYNNKDKLNINEDAMKKSSYSELLSDNYNYLMWSILAVSIAIGSIYYIKRIKK